MKNGKPGCGVISNHGGDKHGYLGHFRSAKVMERGHNQGAPRPSTVLPAPRDRTQTAPGVQTPAAAGRAKPQYDATKNPIAAARQQKRADVAAAKASGGDVKAARQAGRAAVKDAKVVRKTRDAAGLHKSDMAALKSARGDARATNQAARKDARQGLRDAVANVRQQRQNVRGIMRGGR